MTALDLPPREWAADAPALAPIRPCRLRQPEPPSRAEIIAGRCALAACAALTLLMVVQFTIAWAAGRI